MTAASRTDITRLSIGQCATLACLLEVSAPKPGNVHRSADFEDVTFVDFAVSAVAIAPAMEQAASAGIGAAVLQAIHATRQLVHTNTNLGTVLLLAPLAAVPRDEPLREGVSALLRGLTANDSANVYEAIRVAAPGGLGKVSEMDVAEQPPDCLLAAMQAAAARDLVARQYVNDFATVFDEVLPTLAAGPGRGWSLIETIVHTQLELMQRYGDSLIERKCGPQVAGEAATRAGRALAAGPVDSLSYLEAVADLDFWLRSDGHRRNPGTTADLLAAGLFAGLRDGLLQVPAGRF